MTYRFLFICIIVALTGRAFAGVLTTRDGKTHSGSLQLQDGAVAVVTDQGTDRFSFGQIAKADFRNSAAGAPKAGHGLKGEYFSGKSLKRFLLTRTDAAIDYNWTDTLPHPSLVTWGREFSVRWTGLLRADHSETYQIITNCDDGVRVWVDGKKVIDRWMDQSGGDVVAEVAMEAGKKYDLRVEYYNGQSDAYATLSWSSKSVARQVIPSENLYLPVTPATGPARFITLETPSTDGGPAFSRVIQSDQAGLKAEYFTDRDLTNLNFVRFDPKIDFHFHPDNPPDPSMAPEGSVRWTGLLEPSYDEEYRFHVEAHRRVRLWVDGKLVLDQWKGDGGEYTTERVPLRAGQKVAFKVEFSSPSGFMLCRVRWSSKSQNRDTIGPEAFSTPVDGKVSKPIVGLVYPGVDSFAAAPSSIAMLATGISPNGRIDRVDFFERTNAVASVTNEPFRFIWNKPQPGVYKLRARLVDSAGVTALSEVSTLTVTGKGDGSLKAPWGDFYIANNDNKTPGVGSLKGDVFKIENAVGTLVSENEHDAGHFIVQPLAGDGQIVARVTSLEPNDPLAGAYAGICIRENLKNRCKQFSMLYGIGAGGDETMSAFVRRQDHWMNPVSNEKPIKLPAWFKLVRHGQRIHAFTSSDGKDWDLFASERFESTGGAFAGLVAFSRDANKAATATFDHVQVTAGAPALESSVRGFVTLGGTFVAADVFMIDGDLVRYNRNNKEGTLKLDQVARIVYKPLLVDHASRLARGATGVLMSNGDFMDGEIKGLREGNVSVSSVLFGLKKVWLAEDLTAVVLHDVELAPAKYTLSMADGSVFRVGAMKADGQNVTVNDAALGAVTLQAGSVAELKIGE